MICVLKIHIGYLVVEKQVLDGGIIVYGINIIKNTNPKLADLKLKPK